MPNTGLDAFTPCGKAHINGIRQSILGLTLHELRRLRLLLCSKDEEVDLKTWAVPVLLFPKASGKPFFPG